MRISGIYMEITNRCNLNCKECYNSSGLNKQTTEISSETFEEVINIFNREFGVKTFDISGGEPLLHSEWNEIMDVMERNKDFSFLVVTNGTIRNDRFYRLLETNDRYMVQFSIDGTDEETHSRTRGKGQFEKTLSNLASLKAKNSPYIKMVISRYNMHQIEDYIKMALEYNCHPEFSFAEKLGNAVANWQDMRLSDFEKINVIRKIQDCSIKYNTEIQLPYTTFNCPLTDDNKSLNICIKANGNIQPCQNLYDDIFSIGSIYNFNCDSMAGKFYELRNQLSSRKNIDNNCSRCINRDCCTKGCAATAYMQKGDILASDGNCQLRRLQTVHFAIMGNKRGIS